ncbi:MAG: DUF1501 domain-containing protein [Candidatus Hydrogenedentes bacterium]|nr:DUF1501 domain-containing protein [Candidatus Hydrogenedentota bacterium]
MQHHKPNIEDAFLTRRDFICRCGMGMASLGLAGLMQEAFAADTVNPLTPRAPHFPGKAKRVIHFFLNGGPSAVDTFDPKPALQKYAGQTLPMEYLRTERKTGAAFPSPFTFKKYGQSGIEVSEIFAKTAEHIDDIAVIRSMKAKVPNHEPSLMLMNCGDAVLSRPSMGSWITYGLGSENQNLPGFISMCPGGYPIKEAENWQSGFLPGAFQGTYIDSNHTKLEKLIEHIRNSSTTLSDQRRQLDLLHELNETHAQRRAEDAKLESRMQSFELAYRMQMEAADAFDVEKEPEHIRQMYGEGVHARQTLIARRLLERGVRFVQLWHGAGQPWDNHDDIGIHRSLAGQIDQPIAALITDLKQRGMFDDTLILWGGEFGRTPTVELSAGGDPLKGRDHNPYGFSVWMAGGGIRGGTVYGATDEFGFKAQENPLEVHDLHATMLHLLGFDHEKFTYRYAGRDFRLTDVAGHVVKEVVA